MRFLYCVWDKAAAEFSDPFAIKTDAVALRSFQQKMKDCPTPDDFQLVKIGSFNPDDFKNSISIFAPEIIEANLEMEVVE